jgi:tyrosyl-tRNA synthetase
VSTSAITAATAPVTAEPTAPEIAREAGVGPIEYLRARGYVQDVSDEAGLAAAFAAGPVTLYDGFDPTARSYHVGNLVGIMALASLQRLGHRPIALAGGGTALVGDPSGKTSARRPPQPEEIEANLPNLIKQFTPYLDFTGGQFGDNPAALLLNNADWLLPLGYIEFLRDIGRHFSVNEMLAIETYKNRLETTGLNFVEFNYRLVQAYDFLYLYRTYGCLLQIGGSDQWANITGGVDLIRRVEGVKAFALVTPLVTTSSGQKMGKTEGNAVWLDCGMTTPYDFYQFWVNTEDADVARFMKLFTFLPDDRIADLTAVSGPALREAKAVLAHEATALTHGKVAADEAQEAARALFGRGAGTTLDASDPTIPTTEIPAAEVEGLTVADVFVRAGLCDSRSDARRQAAQGGLAIDGEAVTNVDSPFAPTSGPSLLRRGKKRYRRVVVAG